MKNERQSAGDRRFGCPGHGALSQPRIDLLFALPVEKLERLALEKRMHAIADESAIPTPQHEYGP